MNQQPLLIHQIKSLGAVSHAEHIVFVHDACDHSFCDLMTSVFHNGCDLSGAVYLPTFVIYFSYDRQKFFASLLIFRFSILSTQFSVVIRCFRYLQSFAEKIDRIFLRYLRVYVHDLFVKRSGFVKRRLLQYRKQRITTENCVERMEKQKIKSGAKNFCRS